MKTSHVHTRSREEAWIEADSVFPCDYMHDSARSARAGYDTYFSTSPDVYAWISDLGDRLEVNLPDGSTVNIWIDEPEEETAADAMTAEEAAEDEAEAFARFQDAVYDALSADLPEDFAETVEEIPADDDAAETVEAMHAAERMTAEALYTPEVCQRVTVCVDGRHPHNADERRVYEALKRGQAGIEFDILQRYADTHNLAWGGISSAKAHYFPGYDGGDGHFIVSGYISARIGEELSFLSSCAAVLAQSAAERR